MKHFTIEELCASDTARRRNIANNPTSDVRQALTTLVDRLLDPIREKWSKPITVNSGFRGEMLNKAVGGAKTSQHLLGEAADITAGSPALNKQLFELIQQMAEAKQIEFDQLIWEKGSSAGPAWIHISYRTGRNRKQILHL